MPDYKAKIENCSECGKEGLIMEQYGRCLPCELAYCEVCRKKTRVLKSLEGNTSVYVCTNCEKCYKNPAQESRRINESNKDLMSTMYMWIIVISVLFIIFLASHFFKG